MPYDKFHLLFISLVTYKFVLQVKIGLLFALGCCMPFRVFVQIGEIAVCNVGEINFGHLCHVAIWKKLFVDGVTADAVNIFCIVFFLFF